MAASSFGCDRLYKQTGEIEADLASTWLTHICKPLLLILPYIRLDTTAALRN